MILEKDFGEIEINDRVVYRYAYDVWVWAKVVDIDKERDYSQYKIYIFEKKAFYQVDKYLIKKIPWHIGYVNLDMLDCECGLKFVKNGTQHSPWCKLYDQKSK